MRTLLWPIHWPNQSAPPTIVPPHSSNTNTIADPSCLHTTRLRESLYSNEWQNEIHIKSHIPLMLKNIFTRKSHGTPLKYKHNNRHTHINTHLQTDEHCGMIELLASTYKNTLTVVGSFSFWPRTTSIPSTFYSIQA